MFLGRSYESPQYCCHSRSTAAKILHGLAWRHHLFSDIGATIAQDYHKSPPVFTENRGQWDKGALFRLNDGNVTAWFTSEGIRLQCHRWLSRPDIDPLADQSRTPQPSVRELVVSTEFIGANPHVTVTGNDLLDCKRNFFLGNDRHRWQTNVPEYSSITYTGLYPGIDLKCTSGGGNLTYEFAALPGRRFVANPDSICRGTRENYFALWQSDYRDGTG